MFNTAKNQLNRIERNTTLTNYFSSNEIICNILQQKCSCLINIHTKFKLTYKLQENTYNVFGNGIYNMLRNYSLVPV